MLAHRRNDTRTVVRFAYNLEVRGRRQDDPESRAHERVVIDQ